MSKVSITDVERVLRSIATRHSGNHESFVREVIDELYKVADGPTPWYQGKPRVRVLAGIYAGRIAYLGAEVLPDVHHVYVESYLAVALHHTCYEVLK